MDIPGSTPPNHISLHQLLPDDRPNGCDEHDRTGSLSDLKFFSLSTNIRPVSPDRRTLALVWFQPTRNTSSLFPGLQFQRLVASHQHLLDRVHDESVLLSL